MLDARRHAARATRDAGASFGGARAYGPTFLWLERYQRIPKLVAQSLGAAFAGVLAIAALFMPPAWAAATTLAVAMVNGGMLLCMWAAGMWLNVATLVNLVMSIGFSVDFTAHVAMGLVSHATAAARADDARGGGGGEDGATPMARHVARTLDELGVSVLNGGLSTLVAVLTLSASQSEGFRVLFKMFLFMVVLGLAHGLVFIPALALVCEAARDAWQKKGHRGKTQLKI